MSRHASIIQTAIKGRPGNGSQRSDGRDNSILNYTTTRYQQIGKHAAVAFWRVCRLSTAGLDSLLRLMGASEGQQSVP